MTSVVFSSIIFVAFDYRWSQPADCRDVAFSSPSSFYPTLFVVRVGDWRDQSETNRMLLVFYYFDPSQVKGR